jgi:hypothetical protein
MGDVPDVDVEFLPSHRSNFSQPDAKKVELGAFLLKRFATPSPKLAPDSSRLYMDPGRWFSPSGCHKASAEQTSIATDLQQPICVRLLNQAHCGKNQMSVHASIPQRTDGRRYEAVLRLSGALSLCKEPEDLTKMLSEQLREFLDFLQFYIVVYKENSTEVEWTVVGREKSLVSAYADVAVQQRPSARFSPNIPGTRK